MKIKSPPWIIVQKIPRLRREGFLNFLLMLLKKFSQNNHFCWWWIEVSVCVGGMKILLFENPQISNISKTYSTSGRVTIVTSTNEPGQIQGVQQICFHFCFLNFSASQGSRNFILDIFQLPFPCRVWKCPHLYYLVKSRLRYLQITAGRSF